MTNDEAMKLARTLKVQLEGTDDALLCHVITLCDHILSGSMKREIENAAFKLAITAVHARRMTTLSDLIARLKAAKEGSRELDELIHEVVGSPGADDPQYAAFESGDDFPRNYTTSLDAALTLVPKEYTWRIHPCEAAVGQNQDEIEAGKYWFYGETPALALCIAALKAREPRR